ncbi:hypothetical protein KY320_02240 [Candidatus Woesearchaeota archaeon]|nr:hypothetical protein [Candidatus Woesearchaeota archaeon]
MAKLTDEQKKRIREQEEKVKQERKLWGEIKQMPDEDNRFKRLLDRLITLPKYKKTKQPAKKKKPKSKKR